ncbi:MAG: hypothetical protein PHE25_05725 [Candidatus Gracilibacteria bacterium]|nr:hypothetical protein [Candidatus Gracilibacteria bacterium]
MKKIFFVIITIFLIFSTKISLANENGLIEDMLNLNYGPMIYDLSLDSLDVYSFENEDLQKSYSKMVNYDKLIRDEIILQYRKGNYSTQTTNGIIKNYKTFIYYTNQLFYFFNLIEKNPELKYEMDIQDGIIKNYKNVSNYYKKVKRLVLQVEN